MKTKRKVPVSLRVAAVLLCLVMLSTHFTAGMYARYVTSANGTDYSRAAGFAVSAKVDTDDQTKSPVPVSIVSNGLDDSGRATYEVKVSNTGETAVRYKMVVEFKDDKDAPKFLTGKEEEKYLSFEGELAPGEEATETIILDMSEYFKEAGDGFDFQNDVISGDSGTIPFEVIVTFVQIN